MNSMRRMSRRTEGMAMAAGVRRYGCAAERAAMPKHTYVARDDDEHDTPHRYYRNPPRGLSSQRSAGSASGSITSLWGSTREVETYAASSRPVAASTPAASSASAAGRGPAPVSPPPTEPTAHGGSEQSTETTLCSRVLFDYAKGDPGRRSLVEIIESGRVAAADEEAVFVNANHVLESLCVRLARTANAFKVLPVLLQQNEAIQTLSAALLEPVQVLHAFVTEHGAIDTPEKHTVFVALIRDLSRRGKILGDGEALAQLRIAVGRARSLVTVDPSFFDHFASSLLLHSVSCVVSIQHHLLLSDSNRGAHHVGAFDTQMRPVAVLRDCAFKTQTVCGHQLGISPHIDVKGDLTATLTYIEPHFRYMMTEILKNAAHATVKNHSLESGVIDKSITLPAVTVLVESCDETQAVTVTVTDTGGGMDRSVFANIWRFGYTTAHDASGLHGDEAKSGSGLNGWGFGLPRSLVYARYLGGDIQIENTPGQGCTVRMTLPTATSPQAMECLNFSEVHLTARADEVVQS